MRNNEVLWFRAPYVGDFTVAMTSADLKAWASFYMVLNSVWWKCWVCFLRWPISFEKWKCCALTHIICNKWQIMLKYGFYTMEALKKSNIVTQQWLFIRFMKGCQDRPPSIRHNLWGAINFGLKLSTWRSLWGNLQVLGPQAGNRGGGLANEVFAGLVGPAIICEN